MKQIGLTEINLLVNKRDKDKQIKEYTQHLSSFSLFPFLHPYFTNYSSISLIFNQIGANIILFWYKLLKKFDQNKSANLFTLASQATNCPPSVPRFARPSVASLPWFHGTSSVQLSRPSNPFCDVRKPEREARVTYSQFVPNCSGVLLRIRSEFFGALLAPCGAYFLRKCSNFWKKFDKNGGFATFSASPRAQPA